ncbi:hypothetical protein BOTBODRAFT_167039 [Botryobasidium botryosum FD-172 SS1]|uniref:Nicotinamide N-methyltransferase n=1 Tax=Botryobasidium botryosum (strain FD-172 SS1) TaxID=930990 RepID=A0A067LYI2_BOTB1|nr:hypothetical protein BOTBODRAFT_167039 [Botryobasidium botryosum FD-172 SS1]
MKALQETESPTNEDIMASAMGLLGEKEIEDDERVTYGDLRMRISPKEGKAITLLADQLFSPSLLLAERIERGLIPLHGVTMLELGAGVALPSLLASTLPSPPALVVITDYPDEAIMSNLRYNVESNGDLIQPGCEVIVRGYEWGTDATTLLNILPPAKSGTGYDVLFLSDLLYFDAHDSLIRSMVLLLSRRPASRAYIGAGKYTPSAVCSRFLSAAADAGFVVEQGEFDGDWKGSMNVSDLTAEELCLRKGNVYWWVARWNNTVLQT